MALRVREGADRDADLLIDLVAVLLHVPLPDRESLRVWVPARVAVRDADPARDRDIDVDRVGDGEPPRLCERVRVWDAVGERAPVRDAVTVCDAVPVAP